MANDLEFQSSPNEKKIKIDDRQSEKIIMIWNKNFYDVKKSDLQLCHICYVFELHNVIYIYFLLVIIHEAEQIWKKKKKYPMWGLNIVNLLKCTIGRRW
jgi:hypothetical protein